MERNSVLGSVTLLVSGEDDANTILGNVDSHVVQLCHFDHGDTFLDVGTATGRLGNGSHSSALVHERLVAGRLVLLWAADEAEESHGRFRWMIDLTSRKHAMQFYERMERARGFKETVEKRPIHVLFRVRSENVIILKFR